MTCNKTLQSAVYILLVSLTQANFLLMKPDNLRFIQLFLIFHNPNVLKSSFVSNHMIFIFLSSAPQKIFNFHFQTSISIKMLNILKTRSLASKRFLIASSSESWHRRCEFKRRKHNLDCDRFSLLQLI